MVHSSLDIYTSPGIIWTPSLRSGLELVTASDIITCLLSASTVMIRVG